MFPHWSCREHGQSLPAPEPLIPTSFSSFFFWPSATSLCFGGGEGEGEGSDGYEEVGERLGGLRYAFSKGLY
jgi:hypothetical protein